MRKLLNKLVSPIVIALYQSLTKDPDIWFVEEDHDFRMGKTWIVKHNSGNFRISYHVGTSYEDLAIINRYGMEAAEIGFLERMILTRAVKSRVKKTVKEELKRHSIEEILKEPI